MGKRNTDCAKTAIEKRLVRVFTLFTKNGSLFKCQKAKSENH